MTPRIRAGREEWEGLEVYFHDPDQEQETTVEPDVKKVAVTTG